MSFRKSTAIASMLILSWFPLCWGCPFYPFAQLDLMTMPWDTDIADVSILEPLCVSINQLVASSRHMLAVDCMSRAFHSLSIDG